MEITSIKIHWEHSNGMPWRKWILNILDYKRNWTRLTLLLTPTLMDFFSMPMMIYNFTNKQNDAAHKSNQKHFLRYCVKVSKFNLIGVTSFLKISETFIESCWKQLEKSKKFSLVTSFMNIVENSIQYSSFKITA